MAGQMPVVVVSRGIGGTRFFFKVAVKGRRSRRRIATSKAEFEKVLESSEAMTLKVVESELFDRRVAAARGW